MLAHVQTTTDGVRLTYDARKSIRFGLAAAKIGGNIQHYCKVLVIPIRVIPSLHTSVYAIGATSWNFCLDIWHVVVGAWISSRVQKTLVKVLPWGRRFWLLSSSTYSFAYSAWVPLVTEFVTFIFICSKTVSYFSLEPLSIRERGVIDCRWTSIYIATISRWRYGYEASVGSWYRDTCFI